MGKEKLPYDRLDPQRDRLYKAENEVWPKATTPLHPLSVLRDHLDKWQNSRWFKRICPFLPRKIVLKDGRGQNWARGGWGTIHLIKVSRSLDVLAHEFVHNIIPSDVAWHGAVFAGMYLYVVGKVFDLDKKDELRRAFKRNKVDFDPRLARYGKLGDARLRWKE